MSDWAPASQPQHRRHHSQLARLLAAGSLALLSLDLTHIAQERAFSSRGGAASSRFLRRRPWVLQVQLHRRCGGAAASLEGTPASDDFGSNFWGAPSWLTNASAAGDLAAWDPWQAFASKGDDPVQQLFERWDQDGNGALSIDEFRAGLQKEAASLLSVQGDEGKPQKSSSSFFSPVYGAWDAVASRMPSTGTLSGAWTATAEGWNSVISRVTCWGDGCRVVFDSAPTRGRVVFKSAWQAMRGAMTSGEGRVVYNLFARQLAVFVPDLNPAAQIQADVFLQRAFWLRNLTVSPAAASLLTALAPPGLNFTRFWISDVKVSWNNLMDLESSPIVIDIDSVWADVAEQSAGSPKEIEELVNSWLKVVGGQKPEPFRGRYPLLDAATFRVRHVELGISSPQRYGHLSLCLRGLEAKAVNEDGQQLDLTTLIKNSVNSATVRMSRRIDCSHASIQYQNPPGLCTPLHGVSPLDDASIPSVDKSPASEFLLAPTPVTAVLMQVKNITDLRRIIRQRYDLTFPSTTRLLMLPPLFGDAPKIPPPDKRLCPFEGPSPEWNIVVANDDQFDWIFSTWRSQPKMTPVVAGIGVGVVIVLFFVMSVLAHGAVVVRPRPWVLRLLDRFTPLRNFLLR
ncbi:unnamed protein product [Polarella glacialis]|uniref:EF-hand domain-containing protein n=2 Tax=Polarella glacialis TaxID=89957 RepID=A0A813ICM7_POLGL|nr:unnamed protein product [Polarella glacialis]